jgi:16S rRNA (cytosine967-C5)-methyltransferase
MYQYYAVDVSEVSWVLVLGAYQILYSNIAQHASIYETVDIADGLDKPWAKKLVNAILRQIQRDKDKILKDLVSALTSCG